jgi:hypothetical protein
MAIVANENFFIRLDYSLKVIKSKVEGEPDTTEPEVNLCLYGNGVIEGENILFEIKKSIPYDGTMTLDDLVAAAQAAISGKTTDTVAAVSAAPLVKVKAG